MIRAIVIGVIAVALIFFASEDAAQDDMIGRIAAVVALLLITPFVFAWKMVSVPAALDAEASSARPFVDQIRALEEHVKRIEWQINPEAVKRSPTYIRLRFMLEPATGSLSPISRIEVGQQEFEKLRILAMAGDLEAYYTATFVAEWLRDSARKYFASGTKFQEIQQYLSKSLYEMHNHFRARLTSN